MGADLAKLMIRKCHPAGSPGSRGPNRPAARKQRTFCSTSIRIRSWAKTAIGWQRNWRLQSWKAY
eukprot:1278038-Prymnesium_polylepis.1